MTHFVLRPFLFLALAALPASPQHQHQEHPPPGAQPASPHQHAEPAAGGMNAGGDLLMEQGSGTGVNPAASPMQAIHGGAGGWNFMFHGLAFATAIQQTGPRGRDKFVSTNWLMGSAERRAGRGTVMFRGMFSLDPATVTGGYYPLLFQTGETANGRPIVDGQHPHDLFMELSVQYTRPLGENTTLHLYAAPVGDPALGPVAFPHRISALEIPQATLGHHVQDSTHIAASVLTAGIQRGMFRLEASGFRGAEPDERRWNVERGAPDSWAARLWMTPTPRWAAQVSVGRLSRPEALEPGDIVRSTASLTYHRPLERGDWSGSLIWGRNHKTAGGRNLNSYLAESVVRFREKNYVAGRFELLDRDELFPGDEDGGHKHPPGPSFRIAAYTLGYTRDVPLLPGVATGLGGNVTLYTVPSALQPLYGEHPAAFVLYLRVRLKDSPGGHAHH